MTATTPTTPPAFDHWFERDLPGLYTSWKGTKVPTPQLVVLNPALADELRLDPAYLRSADGVALLAGNATPEGTKPIAMAYAGHQFGHYSPRLGDGRALLLGELEDTQGVKRDVHLKGSGRTPYARRGDGKATLGPMLREYLIAEALHALSIPTTRALAVVSTGEQIVRQQLEPGAVLTRVATSHLRVGTFEYAARLGDPETLKRLMDHAIARHHADAAQAERPALALLQAVSEAQASLVAHWMLIGFVHGVMNTDNTTISGESIDFGPCAFMDTYDPATVFSSIDEQGRYAYGNQAPVAQWNLTRFAETLLPLIDEDVDKAAELATGVLDAFPGAFRGAFEQGMRAKLGLVGEREGDKDLVVGFLQLLRETRPDYTNSFRALATSLRDTAFPIHAVFSGHDDVGPWLERWRARIDEDARTPAETADAMDRVNPIYIPRNHLVEDALKAAALGDVGPFHALLAVVTDPFGEVEGRDAYAEPAPEAFNACFRTFCGT